MYGTVLLPVFEVFDPAWTLESSVVFLLELSADIGTYIVSVRTNLRIWNPVQEG